MPLGCLFTIQIGYLKFLNPFSVAKVQLTGLYWVDNWVL